MSKGINNISIIRNSTIWKSVLNSFLFGLFFPAVAWVYYFLSNKINLTGQNITDIHVLNPVLFLIDLIPVLLAGLSFFLSKRLQNERIQIYNQLLSKENLIQKYSGYVKKIGKGEYSDVANMHFDDDLGQSLNEMKENLLLKYQTEEKQKWIFDGNYGILNAVLLKLGIIDHYIFWFGESPIIGILLIGLASVWKNVPFVTIFYLAALQTLPHDLYDAATVDGANALQQFLYVTVPQLRHTFVIVFILQTTWAVKLFDLIQVLTKGGPGDKTMVAYYYVYRQAFSYLNIGYGAAGAYIITLIIILFIVLYYKSFKMGAVG